MRRERYIFLSLGQPMQSIIIKSRQFFTEIQTEKYIMCYKLFIKFQIPNIITYQFIQVSYTNFIPCLGYPFYPFHDIFSFFSTFLILQTIPSFFQPFFSTFQIPILSLNLNYSYHLKISKIKPFLHHFYK